MCGPSNLSICVRLPLTISKCSGVLSRTASCSETLRVGTSGSPWFLENPITTFPFSSAMSTMEKSEVGNPRTRRQNCALTKTMRLSSNWNAHHPFLRSCLFLHSMTILEMTRISHAVFCRNALRNFSCRTRTCGFTSRYAHSVITVPSTSQKNPDTRQDGPVLSAFLANTERPQKPPNNTIPTSNITYGAERKRHRSRRAATNLSHLRSAGVRGRVTSSDFVMGTSSHPI
jgi:hypothetical protein